LEQLLDVATELESRIPGNSDSLYYRTVTDLLSGRASVETLLNVARFRREMPGVEDDALHTAGLHVDALVAALLDECGQADRATAYRESLIGQWSDPVFSDNVPRWRIPRWVGGTARSTAPQQLGRR